MRQIRMLPNMTALNLGYQETFAGTKKIRKMREIETCNIPWLIFLT